MTGCSGRPEREPGIREEVEDFVLLSLVALDLLDRFANLTKVRGETLRARFRYAFAILPKLADHCVWQDQRCVSFTDELDQHVEQRPGELCKRIPNRALSSPLIDSQFPFP